MPFDNDARKEPAAMQMQMPEPITPSTPPMPLPEPIPGDDPPPMPIEDPPGDSPSEPVPLQMAPLRM